MAPFSDKFVTPSVPLKSGGIGWNMCATGSVWLGMFEPRKKGPDVWVLRYRENLSNGVSTRRSAIIGTVQKFPNESLARKAALSWLFSMNAEIYDGTTVSFGAVMRRYLAEEIPERNSTASRYRCWLKNHVEPKWRDYSMEQIKPLLVEDWLKKLDLAPKVSLISKT